MVKHESLPQYPTFTYRWQWWSNWDDVGAFNFADRKYLCQASRSRVGKVRFRTVAFGYDGTCKL